MDLSFENYVPPTGEGTNTTTNEDLFIDAVKTAADVYGVEFVVATRNGKYSSAVKESAVLKEVLADVIEINGRPENVKMNN